MTAEIGGGPLISRLEAQRHSDRIRISKLEFHRRILGTALLFVSLALLAAVMQCVRWHL